MVQQQKTTLAEKLYPWLVVITPIIAQYRIADIDFDVFFFGAFFLGMLAFSKRLYVGKVNQFILLMIGYIAITTIINLIFGYQYSESTDIILRAGRYCLYLFIVFFLGNEVITYQSLMRVYRIIAFAATFYVVLQTIVYYTTGLTLPNKIGNTISNEMVEDIGRFRAFYSEPSVMGYSLTPFVACSLLGNSYRKSHISGALDAIIVSVGIILSTSGQGILAIAVVWTLWFIINIKNHRFSSREILLLIAIAIIVVALYNIGILEFALNRAGGSGGAIDARMSGYTTLELLSPLRVLLGAGYGNYIVENTYHLNVFYNIVNYSSLAEFLFTQGIVGTLLWIGFFVWLFCKVNACGKTMLVAMAVLSWSGCPMSGLFFPLWLTLICLQLPPGLFSHRSLLTSERGSYVE